MKPFRPRDVKYHVLVHLSLCSELFPLGLSNFSPRSRSPRTWRNCFSPQRRSSQRVQERGGQIRVPRSWSQLICASHAPPNIRWFLGYHVDPLQTKAVFTMENPNILFVVAAGFAWPPWPVSVVGPFFSCRASDCPVSRLSKLAQRCQDKRNKSAGLLPSDQVDWPNKKNHTFCLPPK